MSILFLSILHTLGQHNLQVLPHKQKKLLILFPLLILSFSSSSSSRLLPLSSITLHQASTATGSDGVGDDQQELHIILDNLVKLLFESFAPNSPERRLIVSKLASGLLQSRASFLFGVSPRMIQRGNKDWRENPNLLIGSATPKQKRQRMDPQRHALARFLLDSLAPVQSGRDYRIIRCTEDFLYQQYRDLILQYHPQQTPVSKKYFIDRVLDKKGNNVRHENAPDFCPLCQKRTCLLGKQQKTPLLPNELDELAWLEQHVLLKQTQWLVYHKVMAELEHKPGLRVIVQDFNKQQTNAMEMQVLSIVLYEATTGTIVKHYFHYLLPPAVKNDILAIIACHRLFFQEPLVKNATELSFWNDGGPKHFKLTANLAHMWAFAATNAGKKITQNFFVSYHGSGAADAAAAHISRAIKNETRNYHWHGDDFQDVVTRLRKITDPDANTIRDVTIPEDLSKVLVDTARGMRSMHMFTFHRNWVVQGWLHSASQVPCAQWQLSLQPTSGCIL